MFKNINQRTATAMIRQSKNRLKELEKKLKDSKPNKEKINEVQKYGIEHTKIIGWKNGFYVFQECQPNGPIDLIFLKLSENGKIIQYNIDAKGIHLWVLY